MPNCHCCGKSTNSRNSSYDNTKTDICWDCSRDGAIPTTIKYGLKKFQKGSGTKCKNYPHKKKKYDGGNFKKTHKKQYAILKIEKGLVYGQIDASICSMGWSTQAVYLFDNPPKHYLKNGLFVVRVHSEKCPIHVNMNSQLPQRRRNKLFYVKNKAVEMYPEIDGSKYKSQGDD